MSQSLSDKVAIVTGGSRGIGRAIAAALLQKARLLPSAASTMSIFKKWKAILSRLATSGARVPDVRRRCS